MSFLKSALSCGFSFVLLAACADDGGPEQLTAGGPEIGEGDRDAGDGATAPDTGTPDVAAPDAGRMHRPWDGGEELAVAHRIWAGGDMTCARVETSAGMTTKCWGDNRSGQLGRGEISAQGETFVPQDILSDDAASIRGLATVIDTSVVPSRARTCAILESNELKCWGAILGSNAPVLAPPATAFRDDVDQVTMSSISACMRLTNGRVGCWGANSYGQLGIGTRDDVFHAEPMEIPKFEASQIASGTTMTCALQAGKVWCWGLGYGNSPMQTTKMEALSDVVQIAAASSGTCALASDHTVWCWNTFYEPARLLDPTPSEPARWLADIEEIAMDANTLYARTKDGVVKSRAVFGVTTAFIPVDGIEDAVALAVGRVHQCALLKDGVVRCWGNNAYGQLGVSPSLVTNSPLPQRVWF